MAVRWQWYVSGAMLAGCCLAGCRDAPSPPVAPAAPVQSTVELREGKVTISGDDSLAAQLSWRVPAVDVTADTAAQSRRQARQALREGHLYEDGQAAIPLYLALLRLDAQDAVAVEGLRQSVTALLERGDIALELAGDDRDALQLSRAIAAVARVAAADAETVQAYQTRVDRAEEIWELNQRAEAELSAGRLGVEGENGAMPILRRVLQLQPDQPRALQTLAAVESAAIRQAEVAAEQGDFALAGSWLQRASQVRQDSPTIDDARERIDGLRQQRIRRLNDEAIAGLFELNGLARARRHLDAILQIAEPGNAVAADLRQRIDLATHYGLFRPGQAFTDALSGGGRGPQMRVVPHGAFHMGAPDGEPGADEAEQPTRYLRFDRGFALAVHEVTVGEFRRFKEATGHRTRAERRGYSLVWDERSGNFVRRSGADWHTDHAGAPAADTMPVLHVSPRDADAYAEWLAAQTGQRYRLPSEAEFEYALRAGTTSRYPWGDDRPPNGSGNMTGARERSPSGRSWANAFAGYADGYWGPAPVARFPANAYGLHDVSGNVSEWVADCWHHSYRRAPSDVAAWFNPGCRTRVIRGGSWSSAPPQMRSAWRAPADVDTTNAHIGFRVARDL